MADKCRWWSFFIWVLFFWCLERDWGFLAGFVLALCLFKPTLVALPVLMLVLGRRWRVVGGFAGGGIAMAALSVATVGLDGCRAWFQALAMNGHVVAKAGEAWHEAKYMDMLAFFHLLLGNQAILAERDNHLRRAYRSELAGVGVVEVGWRAEPAAVGGDAVLHAGGEPICADLRCHSDSNCGGAGGGERASDGRMAAGALSGSVGNSIIRRVFAPSVADRGAGRFWNLRAATRRNN